jgi:hypothetical protein
MTPELFSLTHNIEIPAVGKWHRITFCDYYGYDAPEIGDVLFVISAEILGDHSVLLHTIWNEQFYSFIMTNLTAVGVPTPNYKFALLTEEDLSESDLTLLGE